VPGVLSLELRRWRQGVECRAQELGFWGWGALCGARNLFVEASSGASWRFITWSRGSGSRFKIAGSGFRVSGSGVRFQAWTKPRQGL